MANTTANLLFSVSLLKPIRKKRHRRRGRALLALFPLFGWIEKGLDTNMFSFWHFGTSVPTANISNSSKGWRGYLYARCTRRKSQKIDVTWGLLQKHLNKYSNHLLSKSWKKLAKKKQDIKRSQKLRYHFAGKKHGKKLQNWPNHFDE